MGNFGKKGMQDMEDAANRQIGIEDPMRAVAEKIAKLRMQQQNPQALQEALPQARPDAHTLIGAANAMDELKTGDNRRQQQAASDLEDKMQFMDEGSDEKKEAMQRFQGLQSLMRGGR